MLLALAHCLLLSLGVLVGAQYENGAGFSGGNGNNQFGGQQMGGMMPTMMGPPFLQNASASARRSFEAIVTNRNLKKSEITAKLDQWAKQQPRDLQNAFENDKKMQTEMGKQMDAQRKKLVSSLSREAQSLAAKIDAIHENQNITPAEEMKQISQAVNGASPSVRNELNNVDRQLAPMGDGPQQRPSSDYWQ